jgi:hypothetical protein
MAIPVILNDNTRLILKGIFDNTLQVNNVFYAKVTDVDSVTIPPPTLQDMGDGLWQTLKTSLIPVTSADVTYTEIVCESLDADANLLSSESYFIGTGGSGTAAGDGLPSQDTWTFKFLRPAGAFRHGYKRFAGVSESEQTNGLPAPATVPALNAIAATLSGIFPFYRNIAAVETNIGGSFKLQLVQKFFNGDVVSPAIFYNHAGVVFNSIGTQNSRKRGRGI